MDEWMYAQSDPSDQLTKLHHFSMKKRQGDQQIEFLITVREGVPGGDESMRFFAEADKQTNQKTAPYTPTGWASSLIEALAECVKAVHRFAYEGEEAAGSTPG